MIFRTEAVSALARLGLSNILNSSDHLPSPGVVSYWGENRAHEHDYIFNPFGSAWNLDRPSFDRALFEAAESRGAQILDILNISSIRRHAGLWHIEAQTSTEQQELEGLFLVDATGRNASVVRRLGHRPRRHDKLVGYFAKIIFPETNTAELDSRLVIEPLEDGWWYSLILQDGNMIAVYLTDSDLHPSGLSGAKKLWHERFNASKATKMRLTVNPEPNAFKIVPAYSQLLSKVAGDKWLAVGDACMAFDPLVGIGIRKALQDGLDSAEAIVDAMAGSRSLIEGYILNRRNSFSKYLGERRGYYRQEQRWPSSAFWKRRHSSTA